MAATLCIPGLPPTNNGLGPFSVPSSWTQLQCLGLLTYHYQEVFIFLEPLSPSLPGDSEVRTGDLA